MSDHQLYSVTVRDLGTYAMTVAADTENEAEQIAKFILTDEMTRSVPEVTIVERATEATAEVDPAATGEARVFNVRSTYTVNFSMDVPATSRSEAERHAQRLYEINCGPFEFAIEDDGVGTFHAREVQS